MDMIKRILKVLLISILSLALSVVGTIYFVKQSYLHKDVPSQIKSNYDETIIIDGIIFDNRFRRIFGEAELDRFREMYGQKKFVHMPAKTQQLIKLVKDGHDEILIKLNSGGGLMDVGMDFVYAIRGAQQRGVTVTCVVDNHAMSMALIIFSECDNRYATFGSKIMWHSIAMQGLFRINVFNASELFNYMLAKNEEVWANTRIHFLPWYFVEHFKNETVLNVSEIEQEGIAYLRVINSLEVTNIPKPVIKKTKKKKFIKPIIKYDPKLGDYVVIIKGLVRGFKGTIVDGELDGSVVILKMDKLKARIKLTKDYIRPTIKGKFKDNKVKKETRNEQEI